MTVSLHTMAQSIAQSLAELNTKILELELERSALLEQELQSAQTRAEEVSAFIGVYSASSGLETPSASPGSTKKARRSKNNGARKSGGRTSKKLTLKKRRVSKKKSSRGQGSSEARWAK